MRILPRAWLLAASLVLVATACGSSAGPDPATTGPRRQAIERLHDYGLTNAQSTCIVDEVGADTVVGADDLGAFMQGAEYRSAAKACIDGS